MGEENPLGTGTASASFYGNLYNKLNLLNASATLESLMATCLNASKIVFHLPASSISFRASSLALRIMVLLS